MKTMPFLLLFIYFCISCKKASIDMQPLGGLWVVNAVIDGKPIKLNNNTLDSATSYSAKVFSVYTGMPKIYLYPVNDQAHPYLNRQLAIGKGDVYSLFFGGVASSIDTVLIKDVFPIYQDSAFGVRFVNMYYNSQAVNITLSTSTDISEFSNVTYKSITAFKKYDASAKNVSYIYQVRDKVTDVLLFSYTLVIPRFSNVTLVLKGIVGGVGANALGVIRVNNY